MSNLFKCNLFLSVLVIFAGGCSPAQKKVDPIRVAQGPVDAGASKLFEQGLAKFDSGQFEAALSLFQKIENDHATSPIALLATFHKGLCFESLKRCQDATETYQKLIRRPLTGQPHLEARTLYRLSWSYECLGDDAKTIATLIDVSNRGAFLPESIRDAEVPARLATSYARIGQSELAGQFFAKAEEGIRRLQVYALGEKDYGWLGQTYYSMGTPSFEKVNENNFERLVLSLKKGQAYLLRAAELNDPIWSRRGKEELVSLYKVLTEYCARQPQQVSPIEEGESSALLRWQVAAKILEALGELKKHRLPNVSETPEAAKLFSDLQPIEGVLQEFALEVQPKTPLTQEAKQRQFKRPGRVVDPEGKLEPQKKVQE